MKTDRKIIKDLLKKQVDRNNLEIKSKCGTSCKICNCKLTFSTGMQKTVYGYYCDDCYDKEMLKVVEWHPTYNPRKEV
jgi:hypothetical protein